MAKNKDMLYKTLFLAIIKICNQVNGNFAQCPKNRALIQVFFGITFLILDDIMLNLFFYFDKHYGNS